MSWSSRAPLPSRRGLTANFCALEQQLLQIDFVPLRIGAFITADANGDAKINLADPIYVINFLFREGQSIPCREAANANGDTRFDESEGREVPIIDISDAAYVMEYLFLNGPLPIGDLECHTSELSTADSCPQGATACDS